MTKPQQLIENEEFDLTQLKVELNNLKNKWVKGPFTLRYIQFLKYMIEEKQKYIQKLNQFRHKK